MLTLNLLLAAIISCRTTFSNSNHFLTRSEVISRFCCRFLGCLGSLFCYILLQLSVLAFDFRVFLYIQEFIGDSVRSRFCGPHYESSRTVTWQLVGDCTDMLCLIFARCGALHYVQASPLRSCLSKGHFSRRCIVCSVATLQTSCRVLIREKKKPYLFILFSNYTLINANI